VNLEPPRVVKNRCGVTKVSLESVTVYLLLQIPGWDSMGRDFAFCICFSNGTLPCLM
jgi:hypothetical protein